MTEIATRDTGTNVGAFDPTNEKVLKYLGLDPRDPKSAAVVAVARRYDLDPVLKHVIVIPQGGVYITRDGLLHVAHQSGQLDGIVVEQEPILSQDGKEWTARVSVYRKDMRFPFTFPGRYPVAGSNKQYAQEMALKAAESHSLRRAFSVAGLPSLDEQRAEMARANAPTGGAPTAAEYLNSTRADRSEPAASTDRARDERRMFAVLGKVGLNGEAARDDRLAVYSALASRPVGSTTELTDDEVVLVADHVDGLTRLDDEDRADDIDGLLADGHKLRGGAR